MTHGRGPSWAPVVDDAGLTLYQGDCRTILPIPAADRPRIELAFRTAADALVWRPLAR